MQRPPANDAPGRTVTCLKDAGLRSVWLVRDARGARTIKQWPATPWMLVKLALRIAQPQRQSRGARRLREAGIATPAVLGTSFQLRRGVPLIEVELEHAPGRSGGELVVTGEHATLARAAPVICDLLDAHARAGLFNRDLKLSNLIIDDALPADSHAELPVDRPRVRVIDPVGVRSARRGAAREERRRMLRALRCELVDAGVRRGTFARLARSGIPPWGTVDGSNQDASSARSDDRG